MMPPRVPRGLVLAVLFTSGCHGFTAPLICPLGCHGSLAPALNPVGSHGFLKPAFRSRGVHRRAGGSRAVVKMALYHVYFDIGFQERNEAVGRMVFAVDEDDLPTKKSLDNFRALVSGERAALDAALRYEGCTFETGSAYQKGGNYKWSHVCKGRGKNIFGKEKIDDSATLQACKQRSAGVGGGAFYGIAIDNIRDEWLSEDSEVTQRVSVQLQKPLGLVLEDGDFGGVVIAEVAPDGTAAKARVLLPGDVIIRANEVDCSGKGLDEVLEVFGGLPSTVTLSVARAVPPGIAGRDGAGMTLLTLPVGGPGSGQTRFDIVRVGESPSSWGTRLLANSLVVGRMVSGRPCLDAMASGRGTPQIVRCGVLEGAGV